MRSAVVLAALVASATAARADDDTSLGAAPRRGELSRAPDNGAPKPGKPIATGAVVDLLDVFKDDFGNFLVAPKRGAFKSSDDVDQWVFYGDKKGVFQQTVIGSSSTNGGDYEWDIWSPRVRNMQNANVKLGAGELAVTCERKDASYKKRLLTQLPAEQAKAFVKATPFYPKLWQRSAHFLARDDDGLYFYVDRWSDDHGGQGFRVFAGMKGAMKEMTMTNVVSDSAGEIFATKGGDLKVVTKTDGHADARTPDDVSGYTAYWKKGGKKSDLTVLPLLPNRYLIYRELGIYGRLGVVCDDT